MKALHPKGGCLALPVNDRLPPIAQQTELEASMVPTCSGLLTRIQCAVTNTDPILAEQLAYIGLALASTTSGSVARAP